MMSAHDILESVRELREPAYAKLADAAAQYLATEDPDLATQVSIASIQGYATGGLSRLGELLARSQEPWGDHEQLLVRFLVLLANDGAREELKQAPLAVLAGYLMSGRHKELDGSRATLVAEEMSNHLDSLPPIAGYLLERGVSYIQWDLHEPSDPREPFRSPIANLLWTLDDDELYALRKELGVQPEWFTPLAAHRPELVRKWLKRPPVLRGKYDLYDVWGYVVEGTDRFDDQCREVLAALPPEEAILAFRILQRLHVARGRPDDPEVLEAALQRFAILYPEALEVAMRLDRPAALKAATEALQQPNPRGNLLGHGICMELYHFAREQWDDGGQEFYEVFFPHLPWIDKNELLVPFFEDGSPKFHETLERGVRAHVDLVDHVRGCEMMACFIDHDSPALLPYFHELVVGKSKQFRELAARGIGKLQGEKALPVATEHLHGKKIDTRIGGALLLGAIGGEKATAALTAALENEEKDKVRTSILEALEELGAVPGAEEGDEAEALPLATLEADFEKQAKRLKLPKGTWLDFDKLPPLPTTSGEPLSELGLTFLVAKQSKHKIIAPAPDIRALLAHFDRTATSEFALALFDQWLGSDQAASDRWVLTLTGLLADSRAIPILKQPIQGWADASRHKLAEYAAQAIGLIPGDEALMILDGLANRYRSKYKNIGRACREALEESARERGVSMDDLGDMIVPDFDFDEDGQRTFTWDGGSVIAQMGPEFKLSWINPETEKETKSIPASVPAEVKAEVKTINKFVREGVKGQTGRLEQALVRQRRWTVPRWEELYTRNPLLQSFASRLVWGLFDAEGVLQGTFRRYPNGLLADAAGELIELEDREIFVGMVHPLELEDAAIEEWKAHLGRFQVKPPFPQLERPVARLDPKHGNRKEINVVNGKEVSGGTLLSRTQRFGWVRGSVADAGMVTSYYKEFPGAGVEVFLSMDGLYIGIDPTDPVTLGMGYFVTGGSVNRGSYEYDEPSNSEDQRVLRFDQVPPVVYSETLSDLAALAGGTDS